MRIIRPMTEEGWRPVTEESPVEFAPPSINSLIMKCCSHDPRSRPSFADILDELSTTCKLEVEANSFARKFNDPPVQGSRAIKKGESLPLFENMRSNSAIYDMPGSPQEWTPNPFSRKSSNAANAFPNMLRKLSSPASLRTTPSSSSIHHVPSSYGDTTSTTRGASNDGPSFTPSTSSSSVQPRRSDPLTAAMNNNSNDDKATVGGAGGLTGINKVLLVEQEPPSSPKEWTQNPFSPKVSASGAQQALEVDDDDDDLSSDI
jgi:serine/threonine protein kinase